MTGRGRRDWPLIGAWVSAVIVGVASLAALAWLIAGWLR